MSPRRQPVPEEHEDFSEAHRNNASGLKTCTRLCFSARPTMRLSAFCSARLDNDGAVAVRAVADSDPHAVHESFQDFFSYIDAQKIRTPKGLDWIRGRYGKLDQL
jgi:hypothetical protein